MWKRKENLKNAKEVVANFEKSLSQELEDKKN